MPEEESFKKYSDLAPGLEQVIDAGDTLVMRDSDGNEFAVGAREHPDTMEFLKAFDEWFMAKEKGNFSAGVLDALWHNVRAKFNDLPMRVQRELPSMKNAGVLIRGHNH